LILFLTAITPVLTKFLDSSNPTTHLFSAHTAVNKDLFPRLSGSLNVSMIADIISLTHTEGAEEETVFKRPIYAGNAILEIKTTKDKDRVRVVTVRTTAFDKATLGEGNGAEVVQVEAVGSSSKWDFSILVWSFLSRGDLVGLIHIVFPYTPLSPLPTS
jgi:electron transfer flavoprotein alpha subunit